MGTNFFTDPRCVAFCTEENACTDLVNELCVGTALETDSCRFLCFSNSTTYDCGQQLLTYCHNPLNSTSEICPCFQTTAFYQQYYLSLFGDQVGKAQAVINQITTLPYCSYVPCSTSQFLPRTRQACPIQAICVNSIRFDSNGNLTFEGDAAFNQSCRIQLDVDNNVNPFEEPAVPGWLVALLVIVGLVFLFVIAVVIYYLVVTPRKKNRQSYP
jgi:hypothetical protein